MTAFVMEAGRAQFGSGVAESLRRFVYRAGAAIAILVLLALLLLMFIPMAIIGMVYMAVRSIFGGFRSVPRSGGSPSPIPEEDGEGRENVRVRRGEGE